MTAPVPRFAAEDDHLLPGGYARFSHRLGLTDRALRDRLRLARLFLVEHPDLGEWMARPTRTRLADLRRIKAWPLVSWAALSGLVRLDLDLLAAKDLGGMSATVRQLWPEDFERLWETARQLGWSYYWGRSVIDQFVPAVIAWSHTAIREVDAETLDGFAAALEEVTSASATTLRQWRGRLFGLRQLLFECGQLPEPPRRGPDSAPAEERLAVVPAPQIRRAMARYVQTRAAVLSRSSADGLINDLISFGAFLGEKFPGITSLAQLERHHIEAFLAWNATRTCYRWAIAEGHAEAEPFTYRSARALFAGTSREVQVNLAIRRTPKPHVTVKYLEPDFTGLFRSGLRGLAPDGSQDSAFHGRELARNAAVGDLALATGLRLQEFTCLLPWEVPPLPAKPTTAPIPFPVPAAITKGRKFRTTWISYEALATVHDYLELDRAATAEGSGWAPPQRWGDPLRVTDPGPRGGRINGTRCSRAALTPADRCCLIAPEGGSCLLALRNGGGPFTAWATVFERTADRIRVRFEPRFPHVWPHRLRHTFSMRTLEYLVSGHYRQAAKLVKDTDDDAALIFYLSKADPLLILRDLLGHSSTLTTEKYLRRLDTTRIYREAYELAGTRDGLLGDAEAEAEQEATAEFADDGRTGAC